jgi:hypothetical protein
MKKLIYILMLTTFAFISCDSEYDETPNSGWVEFDNDLTNATSLGNTLEIPISLPIGTNLNGLEVTYSVEITEGSFPNGNLGTFKTMIPKGENTANVLFNVGQGTTYIAKITLLSTDDSEFLIGLTGDETKIIEHEIAVCADGSSELLNGGPNSRTFINDSFLEVTDSGLTLVDGETNVYSTENIWGDYVYNATGNPAYIGGFKLPGLLTLNDDKTITFESGFGVTQGTYDSCLNEFQLPLAQPYFAADASVILF